MNADVQIRPQHKVCQKNVEVPTILVEPFNPDGDPEVFVQWFGEAQGIDLGGIQFRFPVPVSTNALRWMGHPELFKVILFGQVKDWPKKEAIRAIVDLVAKGSLNAWILWVTSYHYGTQHSDGPGPACFVVPMTVMLADGVCGVVTPRKYCDTSILDHKNEKFRQQSAR